MWTYEVMNRAGYDLLVIYLDDDTVGSLMIPEDKKEYLELWKLTITNLNNPPSQPEKLDPLPRS